ncbi:ASCH domain-containing protein [Enterococcus phoeniculicola]|uniref:ASCH domain-containing protein n=1 Tax=Enterococcus phoeniculicola ATCC BAA-412 TaxID=1158610 RepID=R3WJH8_9ENTE|nr:ASCH domain-containing protein [Enterococcus phoeniculicola]EOL47602.1 hypothetical protein UC3_00605 [Enterococcus phoeniculicola ATCC BAA-412]EOT72897.1 hypothetical protein I589_03168 [Enterococcus phoeniculicola ATCC BAA-412]
MHMNQSVKEYWQQFAKQNQLEASYEAWSFGNTPEMADELVQLVIEGTKRATTSAYPLYEIEGEILPKANEYSILLDGNFLPRAIIRTTKVEITAFNKISEEYAYIEGEGDKSLPYWKEEHKRMFDVEMKNHGQIFTEEMLCVCEYFECVHS